jgi:hypothetical protein
MARSARRDALRYRAAGRRLDSCGVDPDLQALRAELRGARERLEDLRAELAAMVEAEVRRALVEELPQVLDYYLYSRRNSRNGAAQTTARRD